MQDTPIADPSLGDLPKTRPWDPVPGESHKSFQAFCLYRDLGPLRSLPQAAAGFYATTEFPDAGKKKSKVRQIQKWSRLWRWVDRAHAFDRAEVERHSETLAKEREDSRRTRLGLSRLAMLRATEKLKATHGTQMEVDEAIRLLEIGMKNERLDLGEATERRDEVATGGVMVMLPENGTGGQTPAATEEV